jgi:predicted small secreted protein
MIRYSRSIAILVSSGILTACATAGKDISSTY